jgi:hypothetical protein
VLWCRQPVCAHRPQPYSSHHDSFLQRYIETGQAHILNKSRCMVALNKVRGGWQQPRELCFAACSCTLTRRLLLPMQNRSMFPIQLAVTRLSGVGADQLLMGVVRPALSADEHAVTFHMTADGVVLCSDSAVAGTFGMQPEDVLGRPFISLTSDVEGVNRCDAAAMPAHKRRWRCGVQPGRS